MKKGYKQDKTFVLGMYLRQFCKIHAKMSRPFGFNHTAVTSYTENPHLDETV